MSVHNLRDRVRYLKKRSSFSSVAGTARRMVFSRIYLDIGSNYRDTIFLASSPRSGSTWISSVINYRNDYRSVFEPFHPMRVPMCRSFRYRQYLRPENRDQRYLEPARAILKGRIRNKWVDQRNEQPIAKKRLIKDVRANLFLKWLRVNFPEPKLILLVRHPCAVANSRMSKGWSNHLDEFLVQGELMRDFLEPFREDLEAVRGDFEKHVVLWCIENYVPLRQLRPGEVYLAFYEDFCASPQEEFERLLRHLQIDVDERLYRRAAQPVSARGDSSILTGNDLIAGWRRHISVEQERAAIQILSIFGLDRIYSSDPMPDAKAALELMAG